MPGFFSIIKSILLLLVFTSSQFALAQKEETLPFRNTALSFEQRVNDLVSRLTLEEKVSQMLNGMKYSTVWPAHPIVLLFSLRQLPWRQPGIPTL